MRRDVELEATIVEKYAAVEAFLDERGRRIWAATESRAIGYGGDAVVSDATGLSRPTIRKGRRELESGGAERGRIRRAGAGRPGIKQSQPDIKQALEKLVDPLTRGDPQSALRWTCKSRAKLAAALSKAGWKVSTTGTMNCIRDAVGNLNSIKLLSRNTVLMQLVRNWSGCISRHAMRCSWASMRPRWERKHRALQSGRGGMGVGPGAGFGAPACTGFESPAPSILPWRSRHPLASNHDLMDRNRGPRLPAVPYPRFIDPLLYPLLVLRRSCTRFRLPA